MSNPCGYNNWTAAQPQYQAPLNTNIILVTSLEEAVMRTTRPFSDMIYFNQNGGVFYRVKVEGDGRKSYQEFPYQSSSQPKSELSDLIARIEALEAKFKPNDFKLEEVKIDV